LRHHTRQSLQKENEQVNESKSRLFLGLGLLILGIVFLLQNIGVLRDAAAVIWPVLFGLGGLVFLGVFLSNREHWWAIIPGSALLGIALLMALTALFPARGPIFGGAIFMGTLAAGFLAIFAFHPDNWWAVIPGGVLLTIAVVSVAGQVLSGAQTGAIMMLGMAATFAALALIETPQGRMRWPLIPAGVLLAIGLLIMLQTLAWLLWLIALMMIAAGGYLVIRGLPRAE
jgi:hypothetical protein